MLRRTATLALVATLATAAAGFALAVGDPAPPFRLTDLDGRPVALESFTGKIVVLEWMNPNCPFSKRHSVERTMTTLVARHPEIVFLAINSTSGTHRDFLPADAYRRFNAEHGIGYPVLSDTDGAIGRAYGAKTTPHMFVIDAAGRIAYDGAIDDAPQGGAKVNYVEQALAALAAGRRPAPATTKPYGCSVKY